MASHGRPRCVLSAIVLLLLLRGASAQEAPTASPLHRAMQEDAELTDVCFIDAANGWAVGDRGVIWRTADGGRRWERQESGVTCRLESVCFVDAGAGWIAGGETTPYTHGSRGVLLRTRTGGADWLRDKTLVLPALKQVKFFNRGQGWALGDVGGLFTTGLFSTDDGGGNWKPTPGPAGTGFIAGDFFDPLHGAVAGREGQVAAVERQTLIEATTHFGLRRVADVRFVAPGVGWLVGDGGLIRFTNDGGRTWVAPNNLPPGADRLFDWRTIETVGPHCWIAGAPGSKILHTADGGRSWEWLSTGQPLPINAIDFVDAERGWAVGAMGQILATVDGGRSWRVQHAGGTRAAMLCFFSDGESMPFEAIAGVAANDGYLTRVEFLNRRDLDPSAANISTEADRARAAAIALGCSSAETAWGFPVRQAGLNLPVDQFIEAWDNVHDGEGLARFEEHVVRAVRIWRPDVVLTHSSSPRGDDKLGHLINQLVLRAVEKAANPAELPDQLSIAELQPWKVSKIAGALPAGQSGEISVGSIQVADRLGMTLADSAMLARSLVEQQPRVPPESLGFRVYREDVPQTTRRELMSGVILQPAGGARRLVTNAFTDPEVMRRAAQRRRTLQAIIERPTSGALSKSMFWGTIGELTYGMGDEEAGQVMFQLAHRLHRAGEWEAAAETLERFIGRYPTHPFAESAAAWLLEYWSSAEVAHRAQGRLPAHINGVDEEGGSAVVVAGGFSKRIIDSNAMADKGPGEAQPVNYDAKLLADVEQKRLERAIQWSNALERNYSMLSIRPGVQFPLAAAFRRANMKGHADQRLENLVRTSPSAAWVEAARGELWLDRRDGPPPRQAARVARVNEKPRLDGKLDEPLWRDAKLIELRSALHDDAEWPAVVLLAHDGEFLYWAADCRRVGTSTAASATGPRKRDADLSRNDRVELFLDIDRDAATYYRLCVDVRGWAADECCGDATWDPEWYVAHDGDESHWTIEAAIPWSEIASEAPGADTIWSAGVQRIVPDAGLQSWTSPAAVSVRPEGFGHLTFE